LVWRTHYCGRHRTGPLLNEPKLTDEAGDVIIKILRYCPAKLDVGNAGLTAISNVSVMTGVTFEGAPGEWDCGILESSPLNQLLWR
jgi:hypothetical protein